jgi:nitroreductase
MDTIDCINSRRSVRKFQNMRIPEQVLYSILDAANMAPCAGGLQTWRFLIVEEEKSRKLVARAALNQDWIAAAPTIVILCSMPKQLEVEFGKRALELYDMQNTAMAAENLMLAAWNLGVGSTFVSSFVETLLRKEFQIPNNVHIHGIMPLGYTDEMPVGINRIGVEDLVHFEKWGGKTKKELVPISAAVYPEEYEMKIGEEAEKLAKGVVEKVKRKVKSKIKKKTRKK